MTNSDMTAPKISDSVRLDPDTGYSQQVIGWPDAEDIPDDWPLYVRADTIAEAAKTAIEALEMSVTIECGCHMCAKQHEALALLKGLGI